MTTYVIRTDGCVIRDDGATIPADEGNRDYCDYLDWVKGGGVATQFQEPDTSKAKLQAAAQTALDSSDVTLMRCYEAAVLLPQAWKDYRVALRAIVSGKSTATELPARPAYPAGT